MKKNLMLIPAILILTLVFSYITADNGQKYMEEEAGGEDKPVIERTISVSGDAVFEEEAKERSLNETVEAGEEAAEEAVDVVMQAALPVTTLPGLDISDEQNERISYMSMDFPPYEAEEEGPPKINMVVDLDYDTDVDDVVALRVAAQLHRYERIELKAVMASSAGEKPCQAMHAQLAHDGLNNVPIGYARGGIETGSPYWKALTDSYFSLYGYQLYDSVELYKKAIRECMAKDEKLRIVTTGYLVNIEALLMDPQGYSLVKNGVESIWITGGVYPKGYDHNLAHTEAAMRSANYVSLASPVPLVYSSQLSIQNANEDVVTVGQMVLAADTYETDPVTLSFRAYEKRNKTDLSCGRFAWDPFCVWAAALTPEETMTHTVPVNMTIGTNGWNEFSYDKPANSSLLLRDHEDVSWYALQLEAWDIAGISGMSLPAYAYIMGNDIYDSSHPDEEP